MKGKTTFLIAVFISFICHCAVFNLNLFHEYIKENKKNLIKISVYESSAFKEKKEHLPQTQPLSEKKSAGYVRKGKTTEKKQKKNTDQTKISLPPLTRISAQTATLSSLKSSFSETIYDKTEDKNSENLNNNIQNTKESFTENKIYTTATVSRNPRIIKYVEPEYPEELIEEEVQGQVIFNIIISPEGVPSIVSITKTDDERFNNPAIKAVKSTLFSPAELEDGTKVSCKKNYAVTFKIEDN